jgi:membrane fusion protein, multidrug efflux system
MKKFFKIIVIIAAVLIIAAVILYQTGTFRSGMIAPGEQIAVKTKNNGKLFKLTQTKIPLIYKTVGTVRSRDEIELSPRIIARITKITRRSGDSVKAGEVLVHLDDSDLRAGEREAAENLNVVEAALQLAIKSYKRQKLLLERNVIPKKIFEQAEQVLRSTMAREKAARQALRQAQANLSYATIKSPMNGIVSDRMDDPGDLASPGNIIMKIFDSTRLMLYVPLRESLVKSVKIDDKIKFNVESLKRSFTGDVSEIVPAVDPGSRTFLIKMCIKGSVKGLMPGMFGTVEIRLGDEQAYIVPSSAITRIGQLEYLTIMQNNKLSKVLVRTVAGPKPGKLRIVSGIDSDTAIVLKTKK